MTRSAIALLAAALTISMTTAVFAAPNTGKFSKSAEGRKKLIAEACASIKMGLDHAEKEADKRAGTKAAKPYSDEADWWWEQGKKQGCGWAS